MIIFPAAEPALPDAERVETPRLKMLCRRGDMQIAEEWIVHHRETALLIQWFLASSARAGTLARGVELAAARLDAASKPPSPTDLGERRIAESDPHSRPDVLIRTRRTLDHERRLRATEVANLKAQQELADVMLEVLALADLILRRMAVTRIRIRRIHDHTWRRIAVYWQRLVRSHPQGPELNAALAPLGPRLPAWARDDTDRDRLDGGGCP